MKYFLFTMKLRQIPPNFQLYLRYLKHRIEIEKVIALNNDKAETHNKSYEILANILKEEQ